MDGGCRCKSHPVDLILDRDRETDIVTCFEGSLRVLLQDKLRHMKKCSFEEKSIQIVQHSF